jgi:hypothetical protein
MSIILTQMSIILFLIAMIPSFSIVFLYRFACASLSLIKG